MEGGWNNLWKIVGKVASGVLGRKVKNKAGKFNNNGSFVIKQMRGLYRNYLSDRSHDN